MVRPLILSSLFIFNFNVVRREENALNQKYKRSLFTNITRFFLFVIILIVLLIGTYRIFKFKYGDGIYGMELLYEQPENSIDVLVLGSSHAFENINPAIFYSEYGIAAYDLCGSIQPLWNTYYFLEEALKTQNPKLIILEAFCTTLTQKYSDDSRIIKNTYGMKWSKDKVEAIKVSAPEDRWIEFMLSPLQEHSRYKELGSQDFLPYKGDVMEMKYWKGFGLNRNTQVFEEPDIHDVTDKIDLYDKSELYYRKIIELAQARNIPILVIVSPYAAINSEHQGIYLSAEEIAGEYQIPFINYNLDYDRIGLNFSTDIADGDHLNIYGQEKFTKYLGDYISANYNLPDRRNNEIYQSWEINADSYYQSIQDVPLKSCTNLSDYLANIPTDNCIVLISNTANLPEEETYVRTALKNYLNTDVTDHHLWVLKNNEVIFQADTMNDFVWSMEDGRKDLAVSNKISLNENGANIASQTIYIDKENYKKASNGVDIVIYNYYIHDYVDSIGFNLDSNNNWGIVR